MAHLNTIILGIESSCDDTAAAIICDGKLLANCIANQKIHESYGGVVPELASRAHQQNIIPVVDEALKKANIKKEEISAIAYTRGPGLIGSLLVGSSFAKGLSLGLNIPLIEVNHMQAHILAHFIEDEKNIFSPPNFPFLCLTVSGGHTQIVLVKDYFEMEIIGQTMDDAAGEAFDKMAKIIGFPYLGGVFIDKLAKEGNPAAFKFPVPVMPDLDFSFSGLKTAFLYFIQKQTKINPNFIEENKANICASIQANIIHILTEKLKKAAEQTDIKEIAIAGGVAANSGLRNKLHEIAAQKNWKVFIPELAYCTDNAAMIAITGYFKFLKKDFSEQNVAPTARYNF
ncbi:MAG TPA: tRNA (adenosine(37)-N6)-threonylcarbamoyltransferase complex transferase subunit TsaD [Bacteroidia bacterium]|nr:tRNA (adenosine(37)-N6)-threonylcarbamoyltransferase complex transferase subunit TsaD [Bacteroidia bacterium]